MAFYWVTFEDGHAGTVEASDPETAGELGFNARMGSPVKDVKRLPYPATPYVDVRSCFPALCWTPKRCAGKVRCPHNPVCTE